MGDSPGEPVLFFLVWFGPACCPGMPQFAHAVTPLMLLSCSWQAPGGVVVSAMRLLTGSARLAGVIGWPVAHSRSPRLHGTWLNRHGIDGAYLPLPVAPENFAETWCRALAQAGFAGANVTIPHKEAALAICDWVDDFASRVGAVNTLVFRNGIEGFNTDGYGFIANLRAHGVNPAAGPALILGAGGAARAIAAALQDAKARTVTLCNRTPERAAALAAHLPPARILPWEAREVRAQGFCAAGKHHLARHGRTTRRWTCRSTLAAAGISRSRISSTPRWKPHCSRRQAGRSLKAVEGLGHAAAPGRAGFRRLVRRHPGRR
jgi:shikimate dehydrogenase